MGDSLNRFACDSVSLAHDTPFIVSRSAFIVLRYLVVPSLLYLGFLSS
jgi:hypothetical protein